MFETRITSPHAPPTESRERPNADWSLAWRSAFAFWSLHFLWYLVLTFLGGDGRPQLEPYRLSIFVVGFGVTLLLWLALRLSARFGMTTRLVIAAAASVPAAVSVTTFAVAAVYFLDPAMPPIRQEVLDRLPRLIADESFNSFFVFFAWSAFYVAVSSGRSLRDAERRAAGFERLAQSSQLAALRYQINPHFLFNTLNSLSSLVMTRRAAEAEDMILGLSNFFRATLTVDPTADATLAEEIAFQKLYLDIERVRFPDRLLVAIDVPDDLLPARMPALLLQPLVENAIKHGVARSRETVTLTVRARRVGDRLTLVVEDDAPATLAGSKSEPGTGVGLANVRQRLQVRFGGAASFVPDAAPGGFAVTMTMPLIVDD